ncbi:MAG: M20/M25/M40 family metallo-hydrolase [Bacteroidetes bacterium]|nr:M20/M25/M40 family metallo-hydrolase [Bacteroidota bacterium]
MKKLVLILFFVSFIFSNNLFSQNKIDWNKLNEETLTHFQAILRFDTSDPPGKELPVVEYLKSVLDKEGIENKIFSFDANRPNLVARIKGSGKKQPLLIMGHTDVVNVDPSKWIYPPFSATRTDGYIYSRGTVDDKDNVVACLMNMIMLKRLNIKLDRDVIFLAEAGEEGNVKYGIKFMVENHWDEIKAEYCLAEGGGVVREGGKNIFAGIQTTEKIPYRIDLISRGTAGHGSRPLKSNSILHLARAVDKASSWRTPMRLNETTKMFFDKIGEVRNQETSHLFKNIIDGKDLESTQDYFQDKMPGLYSVLRTSISPNIIDGGYRINVIPSVSEAALDVRALPDEDIQKFMQTLREVINDPQVEVKLADRDTRPGAAPSKLNSEAYKAIEQIVTKIYNVSTIPVMSTGASDMAYLRQKGV